MILEDPFLMRNAMLQRLQKLVVILYTKSTITEIDMRLILMSEEVHPKRLLTPILIKRPSLTATKSGEMIKGLTVKRPRFMGTKSGEMDLTRMTIEGPHLTTTEVHKVTETPRNSQDMTTTQMLSLIQGEETLETSSMELVLDSIQEISKVEMIDHTCQRNSTTIQDQVTLKSMTNMSERIDLATMLAIEISELKS